VGQQLESMPRVIDDPKELKDTARLAFMVVDANKDGRISQPEAVSAANLVVGGFFFRADANGDGSVTAQEAQQVRQQILNSNPLLRIVVERASQQPQAATSNTNNNSLLSSIRALSGLLDMNSDKQLQDAEVRQAVQTAVQGVFAAADTNRDSQLTPDEINAVALGIADAAGDAAFAAADTNNDSQLTQEEFRKALEEPMQVVFSVVDLDRNQAISADEAKQARNLLLSQMIPNVPRARGSAPIPRTPIAPGSPADAGVTRARATSPAPAGTPAPAVGAPGRPR
jgi:Ca2+-binding EF-hand superfamily protein